MEELEDEEMEQVSQIDHVSQMEHVSQMQHVPQMEDDAQMERNGVHAPEQRCSAHLAAPRCMRRLRYTQQEGAYEQHTNCHECLK